MNRCKRCKVEIVDDTDVCPLCGNIVTKDDEQQFNTYPDVRNKIRFVKRLVAIIVYFLVVAEVVLCIIDYYTDYKIGWSLVTGICILYTIFTLEYSFNRRGNHIRKIFGQSAVALCLMLLLDGITGAAGWSVIYGVPCAVMILDAILVICMLVNFSDWQSYLLVQLFAFLVSGVLLILYLTGVTKSPVLPWASFGMSALIFSFCFFIGYREAKNELRKRFYI